MSKRTASEEEPETLPPVSGPQRRPTHPWFSAPRASGPQRVPTEPGLPAPPSLPPASERVLRAVALSTRPVRAPR